MNQKYASIEIVGEVTIHPNADCLDLAMVLGFQCVVQRGLYRGGEKIIYIRPDCVLPMELWAEQYRKYCPKRVRAIYLRKEWSEGIIVPFEVLPNGIDLEGLEVGYDVSKMINVIHYEIQVPQDLQVKGNLPYGIIKTDENRWENYLDYQIPYGKRVDIGLKIDGQSCSFFYSFEDKYFGILGRSLELDENYNNKYTDHIIRYDIKNKLITFCEEHKVSLCIRGESYGIGIQSMDINPHCKQPASWALYSVWLIKERRYTHKEEPFYFTNIAKELNLPTIPLIEKDVELTKEKIQYYSAGIKSLNGQSFEGVVIQHQNGSFKIISKHYDSNK